MVKVNCHTRRYTFKRSSDNVQTVKCSPQTHVLSKKYEVKTIMKWLLTDNPEITTLTFASTSVRKLFQLKKKDLPGPRHLSTVLGKQTTGITFCLLRSEKSFGNIVSQHKRSLRKLIDTGHCCQAGILIVFFGRNLFKQLSLVRHRLDVIQNNDFPSQN